MREFCFYQYFVPNGTFGFSCSFCNNKGRNLFRPLYGYFNSPLFRIYTGLILASAVYVGAGGLLYHLLRMGVGHSSPLFRFTVCLISTSYYTVTVMYVRYILEYISSYRSPLSKRPFYLSLAIAIPAVRASLLGSPATNESKV